MYGSGSNSGSDSSLTVSGSFLFYTSLQKQTPNEVQLSTVVLVNFSDSNMKLGWKILVGVAVFVAIAGIVVLIVYWPDITASRTDEAEAAAAHALSDKDVLEGVVHLAGPRLDDTWYHSLPDHEQLTVQRLALCIGVNYEDARPSLRLNGCARDAALVTSFLQENCQWSKHDLWLLTDTHDTAVLGQSGALSDHIAQPTRANILRYLDLLVNACDNYKGPTELVITYAGHGTYQTDASGEEKDGRDECWLPSDVASAGYIADDLILTYLQRLPRRVRCLCVFDCCHSGTVADLDYSYHSPNFRMETHTPTPNVRHVQAEVTVWSGCADSGTSAETWIDGGVQGAMTHAWVEKVRDDPYVDVTTMLDHLVNLLNFTQKPQLSASRRLESTLNVIPSYWLP